MALQWDDLNRNKIVAGDEEEWCKFHILCSPILWAPVLRIVRDYHLAQDIVQMVFLKTWHTRAMLGTVKSWPAYMSQAARHTTLSEVKKQSLRKRHTSCLPVVADYSFASKEEDPQAVLLRQEHHKCIRQSVDALTAKQRKVAGYLLREDGTSTRDIGRAIGCSHKNVQGILGRIRRQLEPVKCR